MSTIYTPSGKAREYSPYALNLYQGCTHGCRYCYAPRCCRKTQEDYFAAPEPRKNIIQELEKDLSKKRYDQQVLLSFIGDVYCETQDHSETTRQALELLAEYNVPTAVLTKGGRRCLQDLDLFSKMKITIGATLTFLHDQDSLTWEPGAATPEERIAVLKELHDAGIRTFASFEPVIDPIQSYWLIERTMNFVDVYKIGKLNNYQGLDRNIDWTRFLFNVVTLLRANGKEFYIKEDLRLAASTIPLTLEEMTADLHHVR